jgi:hypothetical protein
VYSAKRKKFNNVCAIHTFYEGPNLFIGDNFIVSSERMLHKEHDCKGSVEKKNSGRGSLGTRREDELIDGRRPVIK